MTRGGTIDLIFVISRLHTMDEVHAAHRRVSQVYRVRPVQSDHAYLGRKKETPPLRLLVTNLGVGKKALKPLDTGIGDLTVSQDECLERLELCQVWDRDIRYLRPPEV